MGKPADSTDRKKHGDQYTVVLMEATVCPGLLHISCCRY